MAHEMSNSDVIEQYRNISNKLKKRFLRKPNITEACGQFTSLAMQCEQNEISSYAGLCWISAARCEGSLSNIPKENSYLIRAGRQFLQSDMKDKKLGCINPCGENFQAAFSTFGFVTSRLSEESPLHVGLNLELVDALNKLDKRESTESIIQKAVSLCCNNLDMKIHCLGLLATFYIESADFMKALSIFSEIAHLLESSPESGHRSDILFHCEICRIFLLLILRPAPQKLSPKMVQLLEKYTWGDSQEKTAVKAYQMSEDVFILMQSLVMACQSEENESLPDLETDLRPFLNDEQKYLLRTLVNLYCS